MAWEFEIRVNTQALRDHVAQLVDRRLRQTGRAVVDIMRDADIVALTSQCPTRRLRYVGKPNRYRALQAQRFLHRARNEQLVQSMEVEFDKGGLIFYRLNGETYTANVHTAYHPHSGSLGPIDGFSRRVYSKRVGGHTLYSYKDKLSQDEVDAFYQWFEKSFKKRLRRPKGKALAMKEQPVNANAVAVLPALPTDPGPDA